MHACRKACPIYPLSNGIFRGTLHKRKGPLCRGPSQFKVAGKGIAPALRACGPLRRFRALRATLANAIAFPQLRALTGFDSVQGLHKRKGPLCRGPSQFKVAGKGIAPALRACGPLRRFRALRATLANAIAFPQLRALTGFDSVQGLHKRKGPLCRGPSQFKVAGKGIEPLTRGFSVLCSTN